MHRIFQGRFLNAKNSFIASPSMYGYFEKNFFVLVLLSQQYSHRLSLTISTVTKNPKLEISKFEVFRRPKLQTYLVLQPLYANHIMPENLELLEIENVAIKFGLRYVCKQKRMFAALQTQSSFFCSRSSLGA